MYCYYKEFFLEMEFWFDIWKWIKLCIMLIEWRYVCILYSFFNRYKYLVKFSVLMIGIFYILEVKGFFIWEMLVLRNWVRNLDLIF